MSATLLLLLSLGLQPPASGATVDAQAAPATSLWWGDFDGDARADVLVLQAGAPLRLMRNDGAGGFEDATARAGLAQLGSARAALWQDADGDARPDLLLLVPEGASRLLRNVEGASFEDVSERAGLPLAAGVLRARFLDYDADGVPDLELATARAQRLFRGRGRFAFEEVRLALGPVPEEEATPPPLAPLGPAGPPVGGATQVPPGTQVAGVPDCPPTVADWASPGSCLAASSVPTLGMLWPLSAALNVDPATGFVGVGTSSPARRLDVVGGDVRTDGALISSLTNAPPLKVSSTHKVDGLNADLLDGLSSADFTQLGQTIGASELEADCITTAKIYDGSVVATKLGNGAVTSAKLGAAAVGTSKLATGAVTGAKIFDGTITDADVSASAKIQGAKVDPDFGAQDVATTGSMVLGPYAASGELEVQGADGLASVRVVGFTTGGSSELLLGEDLGGTLGLNLMYDGSANLLQVLRHAYGVDAAEPYVAIERDSGRVSIGPGATRDGTLTVDGSADATTPALQVYGSGYTAVQAESDISLEPAVLATNAGLGPGVRAEGYPAFYGYSDQSSSAGVYGFCETTAGAAYGAYGEVTSPSGYGVYGKYSPTTGSGRAVNGRSFSPDGYGVYGTCDLGSGYAVYSNGNFAASGGKSFVQPHPSDPSKQVQFFCLEGNESGTYFRGSAHLAGGVAAIEVPEEFRLVTEEEGLTVQLTARGDVDRLWVADVGLESLVVRGTDDVAFDYVVNGVRRGFADVELVRENTCFRPEDAGEPFGAELRPEVRELLVRNGVLNPDFTPNEATAAALGWTLRRGEETGAASERRFTEAADAYRTEDEALRERRTERRSRGTAPD